jgi:hypothetical protein
MPVVPRGVDPPPEAASGKKAGVFVAAGFSAPVA